MSWNRFDKPVFNGVEYVTPHLHQELNAKLYLEFMELLAKIVFNTIDPPAVYGVDDED